MGALALDRDERELLARGLAEWRGPNSPTNDVARVIGFNDVRSLRKEAPRLAEAIRRGDELDSAEWRRALVASEIAFRSDVYGSGVEWSTTTGPPDDETLTRLRGIQRKLVGVTSSR